MLCSFLDIPRNQCSSPHAKFRVLAACCCDVSIDVIKNQYSQQLSNFQVTKIRKVYGVFKIVIRESGFA